MQAGGGNKASGGAKENQMASKAYVLIEGAAGTIPSIKSKVTQMQGVKACHAVTGQYDLVALVEGDNPNTIGKLSFTEIQRLDGVLRTLTCNVIEL